MILHEFLRVLKDSKSDHRARLGVLLEPMVRRCAGFSLDPVEEYVISESITQLEHQTYHSKSAPTYNDLLPLATWINILFAR